MSIKIFNTLTREKEEFIPLEDGKVSMYVCGPTVYNYIHIGNARPAIVFDTVRRYLEYRGYDVTYVLNFTDIDDKIIQAANELEKDTLEVADKFIDRKSTRLNSSHVSISYAVFCLKKTKDRSTHRGE